MSTVNNFMYKNYIWQVLLIYFQFLLFGDALICYHCSDSIRDGKCSTERQDMIAEFDKSMFPNETIKQDLNPTDYVYIDQCENHHYCTIWDIREQEKTMAFIRGCSSGNASNFPPAIFTKPILPDNHTTCGISSSGTRIVCVTICENDLCNGPQGQGTLQVSTGSNMYHMSWLANGLLILGAILMS